MGHTSHYEKTNMRKTKQKKLTLQKRGCACVTKRKTLTVGLKGVSSMETKFLEPLLATLALVARHEIYGGGAQPACSGNEIERKSRVSEILHPTVAGEGGGEEMSNTCAILPHSGKCCFTLPLPWSHPFPLSLPSQPKQLRCKGPTAL